MEQLAISNWWRYQHYKHRRPPWVKFYVDALTDADLVALSVASRLVASLLLLVAGNRDNSIPNDATWLAIECGVTRTQARSALADLQACGYLITASQYASDLASREASESASTDAGKDASPRARPRSRRETESESEVDEAKASPTPESAEAKPDRKPRKADPLWDVFDSTLGKTSNEGERQKRNAALKLLRESEATAGELVVRIGRYQRMFPDAILTAHAIATNWTLLGQAGPNGTHGETEEQRASRLTAETFAKARAARERQGTT